MIVCPSFATLARLEIDPLDGPDFASIAEHIDVCNRCQTKLVWLRQNDAKAGEAATTLPGPDDPPRIPGFEIERELGRGGMGVVYQAFQPSLNRRVALKVVRSGPSCGSRDLVRWLREARSFSGVLHDNVVRLYQVGAANGWLYLVLDLVPGGTLQDRLDLPYAAKDAARLLETIARAVDAIHHVGLLHLDLKPSNILLDAAPGTPRELATPRVGDFGIAYRWDDPEASLATTSLAGPLGTPSYMPPEQVVGDRSQLGPTADVYGLGAVLYHVLTGRPPFAAPSVAETLDQVREKEPVPPSRLNPAIHRDLETICLKCLEKDPGRRYASAEALAGDLHLFLVDKPISARPVSAFEYTWRWCRRRPAIASLIAALALTLFGGFVGSLALWRLSEAERERVVVERAHTEAARRLSEENEALATRALNETTGFLYSALEHPESLSEVRILALTYLLRKQASHLRNSRGTGSWNLPGVAILEGIFARRLFSLGKRQEARALIMDSVAYLKECRQLALGEESTLWQLAQSLLHSGHMAAEDSSVDEALAFYDQTSSLLGALRTVSFRQELFTDLFIARWRLAGQLAGRGDSERALRAMEANHLMIASMDATFTDKPGLIGREEPTSGDLAPGEHAIDRLRNASRNVPGDVRLHKEAERCIGNLIASEVVPFSPELDQLRRKGFEDDPGAWAESLVSSIRSLSTELGLDAGDLPKQSYKIVELATITAAAQRNMGKLGDADLTARRLMAFARRLVQLYPRVTESHMVLSEAHFQMSKNPWKREDYPTIEKELRQALESARHAVRLAPRREDVRHLVDRLLPRLAFFDTGRSKP